MHVECIPQDVCQSLSLLTQCLLQQIHNLHDRLTEIRLITNPDVYVREFSRATLG